jgi:hypothetical protein
MRMASLLLGLLLAAGCGKKKDEGGGEANPVPAAGAHDAGLRPPAPSTAPKDMLDRADFVIQLSFTSAERSKDSHSELTMVTVIADKLFYKRTPSGAHADKRGALELNNVTITAAEIAALKQSITDKNLLTAKTIRAADAPSPSSSVRADLKVRVGDQRNSVTVAGALNSRGQATALAATDAYRSLAAFAAELRKLAETHAPPKP